MNYIRIFLFKYYFVEDYVDKGDYLFAHIQRKGRVLDVKKFKDNETFNKEIVALRKLRDARLPIPKLIKTIKKERILVLEKINGQNAIEIIAKDQINEDIYQKIYQIYGYCRYEKVEIDYRPQFFVIDKKDKMYYIGDFISPKNEKINLENYGIKYWLETRECKQNLIENGYEFNKQIPSDGEINKKIVLLSIKYW